MLALMPVLGAVLPVGVVVAATVIALEKLMGTVNFSSHAPPAGTHFAHFGTVVPSVTLPDAASKIWTQAAASPRLTKSKPQTAPADTFTATGLLVRRALPGAP